MNIQAEGSREYNYSTARLQLAEYGEYIFAEFVDLNNPAFVNVINLNLDPYAVLDHVGEGVLYE